MTSTIAKLYSILINYYAPCFAHFFINHSWSLCVHPLSSSPALKVQCCMGLRNTLMSFLEKHESNLHSFDNNSLSIVCSLITVNTIEHQ